MTYDGYTKYDANVAESYDADRQGEEHWRAEQDFMASFALGNRLGSVLDVPVGTGRFFEYYASADAVTGVDISADMLRMAEAKARSVRVPGLQLSNGDATALPFADSSFDTVVCFRLVHLLPPDVVPALFRELARLSRGRVLMQIYATGPSSGGALRSLARVLLRPFRRTRRLPWSHIHAYPHTGEFLRGVARASGLQLVREHVLCPYGNQSVNVLELRK